MPAHNARYSDPKKHLKKKIISSLSQFRNSSPNFSSESVDVFRPLNKNDGKSFFNAKNC